ncbi:MAG: hypothetical protein EBR02_07680 [Alphaproteobacteria bacterium]|nr:hypothetical protein [Alphaproteobacteria bacterium]
MSSNDTQTGYDLAKLWHEHPEEYDSLMQSIITRMSSTLAAQSREDLIGLICNQLSALEMADAIKQNQSDIIQAQKEIIDEHLDKVKIRQQVTMMDRLLNNCNNLLQTNKEMEEKALRNKANLQLGPKRSGEVRRKKYGQISGNLNQAVGDYLKQFPHASNKEMYRFLTDRGCRGAYTSETFEKKVREFASAHRRELRGD